MKQVRHFLRNNLIAGILITVPLAGSFYLITWIIHFFDGLVVLPEVIKPETYLGFKIPGLGIVFALAFLIVVGLLGRLYFIRFLLGGGENFIQKIPVMRGIYGGIKQLLDTIFLSASKEKKQKVVMLEYPRKGIYSIGFLTSVAQGETQEKTKERVYNIFIPTTPNPTSGFFLMAAESEVTYLDMTVEDAFKLIMSGGIVAPPFKVVPDKSELQKL
ncbi:MAG: DUF502 domain-containing protein [Deltaproteobacteria bacterium]|nr:DUF502 domain-containing protein [Deltaproteobacteria bacterium]